MSEPAEKADLLPPLPRPAKWEIKILGWTLLSRFENPWDFPLPSALRYLMYLLGTRYRSRPAVPDTIELDHSLPVKRLLVPEAQPEAAGSCLSVTWLGHASCLFTLDGGVRVLCDPVLSERASPWQCVGPIRRRPAPCTAEDLTSLTAVCISHNHFDHMDRGTLTRLARSQPGLSFYVPMGDGWWLERYCGVPRSQIHELNWWDSRVLPDTGLEIVFTPSSHWSGRTMLDKNRSLWGSFILRSGKDTVFFGGDTGYQEEVFKRIGGRYGPVRLAAIPIGAYNPRDIFHAQHVSPKEAVQIHQDVGSQKSVGIHWGTFCLSTTEGLLQPKEDLREAVASAGLSADSFVTVCPGETVRVP